MYKTKRIGGFVLRYKTEYERWLKNVDDAALKQELDSISGDEGAQRERFGAELSFGTAGLRGIIGVGTARMNVYTVGRASQGMADYLNECYGGGAVAIAYDSRNMSVEFARETARVLAANGITAHIYKELMPTPMLSFAVRELGARAGVMVTASHNPAAYNGYKVYGADGCQMTTLDTEAVSARIENVDVFRDVKRMELSDAVAEGLIKYIANRVVESYYDAVKAQQIDKKICRSYPLKIVYTPLNGAGNVPVRRIFKEIGVSDVTVVPEQELPDGSFKTAPYPNPEMKEALKLGLELSEQVKPDLLLATDPDCDRIGVAARHRGEYHILSGNDVGVLLLDYITRSRAQHGSMPKDPVAVRSVVSTALADSIADAAGVEMRVVLTGFKFIGEQILLLEQQGKQDSFVFGFEESCGYLAGSYVRDKDAVLAAMLVCEMASYHRATNRTLVDALEQIWQTYGYFRHRVVNIEFSGIEAAADMEKLMDSLRKNPPEKIGSAAVAEACDYEAGECLNVASGARSALGLPLSNILEYRLENEAVVMIRPSGTEPKMKIYLTAKTDSAEESDRVLARMATAVKKLCNI